MAKKMAHVYGDSNMGQGKDEVSDTLMKELDASISKAYLTLTGAEIARVIQALLRNKRFQARVEY